MVEKINAPGGIRTHGLRIRNPALYPTELQGPIKYQLVTIPFFSIRAKLCPFVPKNFESAFLDRSWHPVFSASGNARTLSW